MKNTVLAFLSLIIIFICFNDVMACWCRKDPEETNTPQKLKAAVLKEFHNSSAVFSGEIVEWSKGKIRFKVNKIWKGVSAEEITLSYLYYVEEKGETYVDGCSYESFKVGKSYLVYADIFENELQVYGCSRTQTLNEAERDVKILDNLKQSEESQLQPDKSRFQLLMAQSNKSLERRRNELLSSWEQHSIFIAFRLAQFSRCAALFKTNSAFS